ncbi:transcriptional regulator [Streptomyces sp. Ru71]|uniref:AfsR/SARP family transcriptional regulator n=1 Tax=Streptomyces sp. Ru71 TaxID=2080746 RepID=UPI000CDDACF7|nr:AfsR/SARP family transcriptional regulator [Streptomyces sp. Ru71]POX48608.1 transcriptional regulator [Streptomyces sp. Ru71]
MTTPPTKIMGEILSRRPTFQVLGPLVVHGAKGEVKLSGNRQRILLIMLLLESNRVVDVERLIRGIWDDAPPVTARSQIRICVSSLRRQFCAGDVPAVIETHRTGYQLRVSEDDVDLIRFTRTLAQARAEAHRSPGTAAALLYRDALALWRGPLGAGLGSALLDAVSLKYHEDYHSALEDCFELELQLGGHRGILGELTHNVTEHPFRETLVAQLMIALYRSGRTADALALYRDTHRRFREELAIEPGERLQALERFILGGAADRSGGSGAFPFCPDDLASRPTASYGG